MSQANQILPANYLPALSPSMLRAFWDALPALPKKSYSDSNSYFHCDLSQIRPDLIKTKKAKVTAKVAQPKRTKHTTISPEVDALLEGLV